MAWALHTNWQMCLNKRPPTKSLASLKRFYEKNIIFDFATANTSNDNIFLTDQLLNFAHRSRNNCLNQDIWAAKWPSLMKRMNVLGDRNFERIKMFLIENYIINWVKTTTITIAYWNKSCGLMLWVLWTRWYTAS